MKKQVIVTTSWDDNHKLDSKLTKLLKKYNIKGTFYISPNNTKFKKQDLLNYKEIIKLSKDFEIGAHTITHPRLTKVSEKEAQKEIIDSKIYLEKLTKKEIKSFCYPSGDYNNKVKELVKKAGFIYARTINSIVTSPPKDFFEVKTTINCAPPSIRGLCGELKFTIKSSVKLIPCLLTKDWGKRAKKAFDFVLKNGGVFHLWGHSWEIDKYNDWDKLEKVLSYISNKKDVKYLINSQLNEVYKG